MSILLVSIVLIAVIIMLVSEIVSVDLTAIGILVILMATRILTPEEALSGFSSSAVITIASMFILSRALMRTGAISVLSDFIIKYSRGRDKRILLMCMVATAIPSAFINNTPVVVLFIGILMSICCEYGSSPSKYLIPVSYASILGGLCTLIGTSTNLIVSGLSAKLGHGALSMFELAPAGIPIALTAMLLIYFLAPRVLPDHKAPICELKGKDAPHYLAEVLVPRSSRLTGLDVQNFFSITYPGVELFEVVRGPAIHFPDREELQFQSGDVLLIKATAPDLVELLKRKHVELPHREGAVKLNSIGDKTLLLELVITPTSRYMGERPIQSRMQADLGLRVIAVKRRGTHYSEQKIRELSLTTGDVLLVQCPADRLDEIGSRQDFIVLDDVHHKTVSRQKAPLAMAIFTGAVSVAAAGIVDIALAAVTAVFLMIATGCIRLKDAYRAVDVQIIMLIVGTMALGYAMDKTGAAKFYTDLLLAPLSNQSPAVVLSAIILITCILTELMSNSATAVLLLPIAISTAAAIGVSPRPFIMGVCFGASCGFAVPIGYQTHLLVYGPGGYRFSDFLKIGIPLDILTWLMASIIVPLVWPF